MYSRLSRFRMPADRIAPAIAAMQARVATGAQRHEAFKGFVGEMLLVDRAGPELVMIACYRDKASIDSSMEAAQQLRDLVVSQLGAELVSVDEYEIAVADMPSPILTG